jgi:hypothetical protein
VALVKVYLKTHETTLTTIDATKQFSLMMMISETLVKEWTYGIAFLSHVGYNDLVLC